MAKLERKKLKQLGYIKAGLSSYSCTINFTITHWRESGDAGKDHPAAARRNCRAGQCSTAAGEKAEKRQRGHV